MAEHALILIEGLRAFDTVVINRRRLFQHGFIATMWLDIEEK